MKNLIQVVVLVSVMAGCGAKSVVSEVKDRATPSNDEWNGFLKVATFSLGSSHACAIIDNTVNCRGDNQFGQTIVPQLTYPRLVSSGSAHTCAIDDTGVKCWGQNRDGQTNVPPLTNPRQISSGWRHTCAIDDTGVECWGRKIYGPSGVQWLPGSISAFLPWSETISFRSFQDRKIYFDKITMIFKNVSTNSLVSKEQQLLFFLHEGFISSSTSKFFVEDVDFLYELDKKSLHNKLKISSASGIPKTPATLKISLEVLEAGLSASKTLLTSANQREVESLIAEINSTLAAGADLAAAQRVIQHLQSKPQLLSEYNSVERLTSYSAMIGDVTKWIGR